MGNYVPAPSLPGPWLQELPAGLEDLDALRYEFRAWAGHPALDLDALVVALAGVQRRLVAPARYQRWVHLAPVQGRLQWTVYVTAESPGDLTCGRPSRGGSCRCTPTTCAGPWPGATG